MSKKIIIAESAIHSFAKSGLLNTSTAQIAREAGVATGTLFHHFPDKQKLISFSYLIVIKKYSLDLNEALSFKESSIQSLQMLWDSAVNYWIDQPDFFRFAREVKHSSYYIPALDEMEEGFLKGVRERLSTDWEINLDGLSRLVFRNFFSTVQNTALACIEQKDPDLKRAMIYGGFSMARSLLESNALKASA